MPNPSVAVDALQKALDEERRLRIKAEEHITYLTKTTDYTPPTQEYVENLEKKVNSQMRIAKSVNAKLQKQIRTMKDDINALLEVNKVKDEKYAHKKDVINSQKNYCDKLSKQIHELKIELKQREMNGRATLNSWDRTSQQQREQIKYHQEENMKQKQLIDYYELREDYFEKFIEEWESGSHEWREFCEARAHKTGNEEHVGILFDEEEEQVCYDCKKDISSFCRTIDSNDYCLKCAVKHEEPIEEEEENVSAFAKLVPDDMKLSPHIPQARKLDEEHIWNQDNNCIYEKDRVRNGPVGEMKWVGDGWVKCFYPCD